MKITKKEIISQKANQEITNAIKIKQKNAEITKLTANINKGAYKDEADALKLAQDRIKELQGEITDLQKEIAATSESNATAIKTETDQLNALYKALINTTAGTEGRKKPLKHYRQSMEIRLICKTLKMQDWEKLRKANKKPIRK